MFQKNQYSGGDIDKYFLYHFDRSALCHRSQPMLGRNGTVFGCSCFTKEKLRVGAVTAVHARQINKHKVTQN